LGFRQQPGRLALFIFRLPLPLYRAGLGWLLGHTFLLLVHVGRKTGKPHATAAMVLAHNKSTGEAVICSVWGPRTDWFRNLRANPALRVQIGRETFVPQHRFLTRDEAFAVAVDFRRRHPWRLRLLSRVLGWDDLRADAAVREFISTRPFVGLRPASPTASAPSAGDIWSGHRLGRCRPAARCVPAHCRAGAFRRVHGGRSPLAAPWLGNRR
jgi:deazaflavin-dependent oxidoreductase (nitroreductase family)